MKLILFKKTALLLVGFSLLSLTTINYSFEKEADFVGNYNVQTYPKEDGIKRELTLSANLDGSQKTFYDGCPQSEIKFKWKLSEGKLTFYETVMRDRTSCDMAWPEWDTESFNLTDPFTFKILDDKTLILESDKDSEYKEIWKKQ